MRKKKKKDKQRLQPRPALPGPPADGMQVERPPPAPAAAFAVGDLVRVRKGVVDPDFPDLPLGGWTGTVQEVEADEDPPLYLIEWNQYTLDHLPEVYRVRCDREDLDEETIRLTGDELEPATGEQPPLEHPANLVARPLRLDEQDDRLRTILGATSDQLVPEVSIATLDRYFDYLVEKLAFPFHARLWTIDTNTRRTLALPVTVYRLLPARRGEEGVGLVVECGLDEAREAEDFVHFPLADLELPSDQQENLGAVQDYTYWLEEFPGADEEPEDEEEGDLEQMLGGGRPVSPWAFWMTLARVAVYGAGVGASLGSILATLEWAQWGLTVGAIILGLAGLLFGARAAALLGRRMRGMRFSPVVGGLVFGALGALLGGVLGLLVVACVGTILGSIAGSLLGKGLELLGWRPLGEFWWIVVGALAGGLVLAFVFNQDLALNGALYGMGVGALLAVVVLFAVVMVLVFMMTPRQP
jgi:hypothetical protein